MAARRLPNTRSMLPASPPSVRGFYSTKDERFALPLLPTAALRALFGDFLTARLLEGLESPEKKLPDYAGVNPEVKEHDKPTRSPEGPLSEAHRAVLRDLKGGGDMGPWRVIVAGDLNDETGEMAEFEVFGKKVAVNGKRVRSCCADKDEYWIESYNAEKARRAAAGGAGETAVPDFTAYTEVSGGAGVQEEKKQYLPRIAYPPFSMTSMTFEYLLGSQMKGPGVSAHMGGGCEEEAEAGPGDAAYCRAHCATGELEEDGRGYVCSSPGVGEEKCQELCEPVGELQPCRAKTKGAPSEACVAKFLELAPSAEIPEVGAGARRSDGSHSRMPFALDLILDSEFASMQDGLGIPEPYVQAKEEALSDHDPIYATLAPLSATEEAEPTAKE